MIINTLTRHVMIAASLNSISLVLRACLIALTEEHGVIAENSDCMFTA